MAIAQVTLPDDLLEQAERQGLLAPETLAEILRAEVRKRALKELIEAAELISQTNDLPYMSPEEVVDEIRQMRAERRAKAEACV
jgi:post-segregation antitoxin (ccd killing protein)